MMKISAARLSLVHLAIGMVCGCEAEVEGTGFPLAPAARSEWSADLLELFDQVYDDAVEVSIVRLIANPQQFDGEAVRLWGVFNAERESMEIYLDRESYEYRIGQNAIPIISNHTRAGELSSMNGHYVWLIVVYESENVAPVGFSGIGNGHLRDVLPMLPAQVRLKDREAAPPREFDGEVF